MGKFKLGEWVVVEKSGFGCSGDDCGVPKKLFNDSTIPISGNILYKRVGREFAIYSECTIQNNKHCYKYVDSKAFRKCTPQELQDVLIKYKNEKMDIQPLEKFLKGKIIGYKSPIDLFGGNIKAGSVFKSVTDSTYKTDETGTTQYSHHLPKEIVEGWEPIFEKEKISISGYEAKNVENTIVFGCRRFTPQDLHSYQKLFHADLASKLIVRGEKITKNIIDKLIKML